METTNSQIIKSPFKFLRPYERHDRSIFFGREKEVETLYEAVSKNRLVVIYGESGTGKTSLVQCGLANRFEVTDWAPFMIRRGDNINRSLYSILSNSKAIGGFKVEKSNLIDTLYKVNTRYLRPVYLIFDQFEELLILGTEEEKKEFIVSIYNILHSDLSKGIHLLFIIREEYLAWLDIFEAQIPNFLDRRVRVETMRAPQLENVILRNCTHFNITLERNTYNAQQIVLNLKGKGGIALPYLQVYMDMLWKEDYQRTYPNGWQGNGYPPLEFTTDEIKNFGVIDNVLEGLLLEQTESLQAILSQEVKPDIEADFVQKLLDSLVTEEGTKRAIQFTRDKEQITLQEKAPIFLLNIPTRVLSFCIDYLDKSRLLSVDENTFELAHDSLANLIDRLRTDEQRLLYDIEKGIKTTFRMYPKTGEYLSLGQLELYGGHLPQLNLQKEYHQFIKASLKFRKDEKNKREEDYIRTIALKDEAIKNQKKAIKNNRISWFLTLLFLIFASIAFLYHQKLKTKQLTDFYVSKAIQLEESNPTHSLRLLELASTINPSDLLTSKVINERLETYPLPFYKKIIRDSLQIRDLAFHPLKPIFASASLDKVKVWDTGGNLQQVFDYEEELTDLTFSSNGNFMLLGARNNKAVIWEIEHGNSIELEGHLSDVTSVAISKNDSLMLTGSWDRTAKLWNRSGELIRTFRHKDFISAVVFLPNTNQFLTGSWDKNIYLWDIDGNLIETYTGHDGIVSDIDIVAGGESYISASWDKTLTLRALNQPNEFRKFKGHENDVEAVEVLSKTKQFISFGNDNKVIVWNEDATIVNSFSDHTTRISALTISPDERYLITADLGGVIKIRDLSGFEQQQLNHEIQDCRNAIFSTLDSTFITSAGKQIYKWDKTGRLLKAFPTVHKNAINQLALSDDGERIASVGKDGLTLLWNTVGDTIRSFAIPRGGTLESLSFSPDNQQLYTGGWDGYIRVWDINTGDTVFTFQSNSGHVRSIAFSENGDYLLYAGGFNKKGRVRIRRMDNFENVVSFGKLPEIKHAKFHPDGQTIITTESRGDKISLWKYDGTLIRSFETGNKGILCFDISPDGQYLVTGDGHKTSNFKFWKLESNSQVLLATYEAHQAEVIDIHFIKNGTEILTAALDGTVRTWMTPAAFLASDKIAQLTTNEKLTLEIVDSSEVNADDLIQFPMVDKGNYPYINFIGWQKNINDSPTARNYLLTFQGLQPLALQGHTVKEKIYLQEMNIRYIRKVFQLNQDIWEGDELYSIIHAFTYGNMMEYQILDRNFKRALAYVGEGNHPKYDEESERWFALKTTLVYLVNNRWEAAKKIMEELKDETIGGNISFTAKNFNLEKFKRTTLFKEVLLNDIKRLEENNISHKNFDKMKIFLAE